MMIGSVNGWLGTGKTLFLTLLAKLNEPNPTFANFNLDVKGVKVIDVPDLEEIDSGLILIDEAYLWFESRTSMSELNRYLSRMVFQSRKRGLDIFTSQQVHSSIDLRVRDLEDVTIHAMGLNERGTYFDYVFDGWGHVKTFRLPYRVAEQLFGIFNTLEFPDTQPSVFEPRKYNKVINNIVGRLRRKFGADKLDDIRLTKGVIKDFLLEKGLDTSMTEDVYSRLKRHKLEVEARE